MATTSQLISSHTYHYVHLKSRAPVDGPKMNAAVVHESSRPMYFVRFSFVVHLVNKLVVTVMVCLTSPTKILERIIAVKPPYEIIEYAIADPPNETNNIVFFFNNFASLAAPNSNPPII